MWVEWVGHGRGGVAEKVGEQARVVGLNYWMLADPSRLTLKLYGVEARTLIAYQQQHRHADIVQ